MNKENKNHWYDGLFYDKVIAPNQDKSFAQLKNLIEPNSTLLDVGCGTGRLAFQIADKCKKVDAIDLSIKNINLANNKLASTTISNISFYHEDIIKFLSSKKQLYDYAVLSYVIHEVDISLRVEILKLLSQAAKKIILIDYLTPRPKGFWSGLNEIVEFIAGKDHYRNFKSFIANDGIYGLAQQSGLNVITESKNVPSTSHLVVLSSLETNRD